MTKIKLRLNSEFFNRARARQGNLNALMRQGSLSYPTILRYVNTPAGIERVSLDVLAEIIGNIFGVAPEDLAEMRMGDLFLVEGENGHNKG